jgi:transposase
MEIITPNNNPADYFKSPTSPVHKQYLALRMFFAEGHTAEQVAAEFGYTVSTVYSLTRDFKEKYSKNGEDPFFKEIKVGRKKLDREGEIKASIIGYRKKYLSVPEIKALLDAQNINVSERYVTALLTDEGFARLPRRENKVRNNIGANMKAEVCNAVRSERVKLAPEKFSSQMAGILMFLPVIKEYGIDKIIRNSGFPDTSVISRLSAILSFLALKLSCVERYSMDDMWCMDRGMGLFAGLNVLPKAAWFSSYSSGITREMNLSLLHSMRTVWHEHGLLSDTVNLDFTAIPYWGDDEHLENNWSGKRSKVLASIQAVLVQDPDSGILCYGDTTVRHSNESNVIMEFLDFYHSDVTEPVAKYLVFDGKFTTYQNLNLLNIQGYKFITIQRRSKNLVDKIDSIPEQDWKKITVPRANGKNRTVTVYEERAHLSDYEGEIRQVYITDNGREKPAVLITNDFGLGLSELVRKYSRRWLVEKDISEQIHFFHLNRNSSGIVIKVDFDLVMTILAHNLYRLFIKDIEGYSHCEAKSVFNKFIRNAGEIEIGENNISVRLKKKRTLPLVLDRLHDLQPFAFSWLGGLDFNFFAANSS